MILSKVFINFLLLLNALIWLSVINLPDQNLHIIACDVGQGDAILITQNTTQIIIDGGPNNRVLDCLGKHLPFWDRTIEAIILTHPQADHYTGLIEVIERYNVQVFASTAVDNSNKSYGVLKSNAGGKVGKVINLERNEALRLGLIYLDIVSPSETFIYEELALTGDENVLGVKTTNADLNNFSVVARLTYQEFNALFTGDIGEDVISNLEDQSEMLQAEYIKVPHHGSKNGLNQKLLEEVQPEIAVISVGKDNSYGHPHKEVLEMLKNQKVLVKRTDLEGDIEIVSDGVDWWLSE